MSLQRSITDIGFKVLNEAHRALLRLSGGRIGHRRFGMPVVELRTVGRKIRADEGDHAHLADSRREPGGAGGVKGRRRSQSPVVRKPDGQSRRGDPHRREDSRSSGPVPPRRTRERSCGPQIVAAYKGYGGYQEQDRHVEIPVVICEPRPAS